MQTLMYSLFEVFANNSRVIVHSDDEHGEIYTWNHSVTFQVWGYAGGGEWEELDIRTSAENPKTFEEARVCAKGWQSMRCGWEGENGD